MTITAPTATKTGTSAPSAELREQFERDGYLVIKGALTPDEVDYYANALDEVYEAEVAAGRPKGSVKVQAGSGMTVLAHLVGNVGRLFGGALMMTALAFALARRWPGPSRSTSSPSTGR